ncbi:MAG: LamG domain-containing protein [Labilithrix sp.]|nr:LamG domain-containing protein [Labilithrix sp.]MCW5811695.1 LamG domain-containing protein [Labilithrix sp.]
MTSRAAALLFVLAAPGCTLFFLGSGFTDGDGDGSPPQGDAAAEGAAAIEASPDDATTADDAPVDAPPAHAYVAAVMADAPASYWRLEEPAGNILADEMGRRPLTIIHPSRVQRGQKGALSGASITLNGNTELRVGGEIDLSPDKTFTLEAWVRPTSSGDDYRRLFSKITIGGGGPLDGTYAWLNAGRGVVGFERWRERAVVDGLYWDTRLPADRFTHLVIVYDGVRSKMYADAMVVATAGGAPEPAGNPDATISWGFDFEGGLDELAIYDAPLTADRVKAHFDAAKLTPP